MAIISQHVQISSLRGLLETYNNVYQLYLNKNKNKQVDERVTLATVWRMT